jgi:hypothetical protein
MLLPSRELEKLHNSQASTGSANCSSMRTFQRSRAGGPVASSLPMGFFSQSTTLTADLSKTAKAFRDCGGSFSTKPRGCVLSPETVALIAQDLREIDAVLGI